MKNIVLCLILTLGMFSISIAQNDPIADCPEGLVCLTVQEVTSLRGLQLDHQQEIARLRRDLAVSKAKRLKRFGSVVGCGGGVIASSFADTADVGVYCGYMWGWRF